MRDPESSRRRDHVTYPDELTTPASLQLGSQHIPDVLHHVVAKDVKNRAEHVDLFFGELCSRGLDDQADVGDLADVDRLVVEELADGLKRRNDLVLRLDTR